MTEAPPAMRGVLYPTNRFSRCPSYHGCLLCKGCQNYNRHSLACTRCESCKPVFAICTHNDEQQFTVKRLEELTKTPMSHPDQKLVDAPVPIASNPVYAQHFDAQNAKQLSICCLQLFIESRM